MSGNPEGIKRPKGQLNMSTKVTIVSQPTNKPLHTCFTLSWCMFSPLYITIIITVFRLHLLLLSLLHNPLQGRRRRAVLIRVTTNERHSIVSCSSIPQRTRCSSTTTTMKVSSSSLLWSIESLPFSVYPSFFASSHLFTPDLICPLPPSPRCCFYVSS